MKNVITSILSMAFLGALIGVFVGPGLLIVFVCFYYWLFTPTIFEDGQWVLYIFSAGPLGSFLGLVVGAIVGVILGALKSGAFKVERVKDSVDD